MLGSGDPLRRQEEQRPDRKDKHRRMRPAPGSGGRLLRVPAAATRLLRRVRRRVQEGPTVQQVLQLRAAGASDQRLRTGAAALGEHGGRAAHGHVSADSRLRRSEESAQRQLPEVPGAGQHGHLAGCRGGVPAVPDGCAREKALGHVPVPAVRGGRAAGSLCHLQFYFNNIQSISPFQKQWLLINCIKIINRPDGKTQKVDHDYCT